MFASILASVLWLPFRGSRFRPLGALLGGVTAGGLVFLVLKAAGWAALAFALGTLFGWAGPAMPGAAARRGRIGSGGGFAAAGFGGFRWWRGGGFSGGGGFEAAALPGVGERCDPKLLDPAARLRLEAAVLEAERDTAGEIVVARARATNTAARAAPRGCRGARVRGTARVRAAARGLDLPGGVGARRRARLARIDAVRGCCSRRLVLARVAERAPRFAANGLAHPAAHRHPAFRRAARTPRGRTR
jgi:hypothetical protein